LLESLGHTVIEDSPQLDFAQVVAALVPPFATLAAWRVELVRQAYGRIPSPETLEAATLALYEHGLYRVTGVDLANAFAVFNQVTRAVAMFMQRYDVLVTPTMPTPPFDLGVYNHNDPTLDAQGWSHKHCEGGCHFTVLFNITGQPAMSLPLGQTESQLPIGIQFIAHYGDEATLFRLAGQLEQERLWMHRQPPICIN
jgi:amidase